MLIELQKTAMVNNRRRSRGRLPRVPLFDHCAASKQRQTAGAGPQGFNEQQRWSAGRTPAEVSHDGLQLRAGQKQAIHLPDTILQSLLATRPGHPGVAFDDPACVAKQEPPERRGPPSGPRLNWRHRDSRSRLRMDLPSIADLPLRFRLNLMPSDELRRHHMNRHIRLEAGVMDGLRRLVDRDVVDDPLKGRHGNFPADEEHLV